MSVEVIKVSPQLVLQGSAVQSVELIFSGTESPASVLAKLLTVDGAGSGLDADTLDGLNSSAFVLVSAYTAADVLAKLLTVDGSGSGLDADTLDGLNSSSFLLAASYTAADVLAKLLTVDGAGSTLDADTLDGFDSAAFARVSQNATFANLTTTGNTILGDAAGDTLTVNSNAASIPNGLNFTGGSVGVNVTPGLKLHVKSASDTFRVETTTARGGGNGYMSFADPTGRKAYVGYGAGNDEFYLFNEMNAAMLFGTNSAERMRIDASGNVGIGLSGGILSRVHAAADNPASGYLAIFSNSHNSAGRTGTFVAVDAASVGTWKTGIPADVSAWTVYDVGAGAERMRIDSSGNVGIGITPAYKLDVNGAVRLNSIERSIAGQLYINASDAAGFVTVNTAGNERMRIDSNGNVGIGIAPSSPLTLQKAGRDTTAGWYSLAYFTDASANKGLDIGYLPGSQTTVFVAATSGAASTHAFYTYSGTAWAERMRISSGGLTLTQAAGTFFTLYDSTNAKSGYVNWNNNSLIFYKDGPIETMRIDSAGRMGIGTSTCTKLLTLGKDDATEGPFMVFRNRINAGGVRGAGFLVDAYRDVSDPSYVAGVWGETSGTVGNTGALVFGTTLNGGTGLPAERMRIDYLGNVGIGTNAAATRLDVRFGTNPVVDNGVAANVLRVLTAIVQGADIGGAISLGGSSDTTTTTTIGFGQIAGRKENGTVNNYAGYLQFATLNSVGTMLERMRIKSTGQVNFTPLAGGDPAGANGDFYYDSANNRLRAYVNGAWKTVTVA